MNSTIYILYLPAYQPTRSKETTDEREFFLPMSRTFQPETQCRPGRYILPGVILVGVVISVTVQSIGLRSYCSPPDPVRSAPLRAVACDGLRSPTILGDENANASSVITLTTRLIAVLKNIIDEEIIAKWPSGQLKVVPFGGTMIGAMRGGMVCDDDLDIAFLDPSNITHGGHDRILERFVADAFKRTKLCTLQWTRHYWTCSIQREGFNATILNERIPYLHVLGPQLVPKFHIDIIFPFTVRHPIDNGTFMHSGNPDPAKWPSYVLEPVQWWTSDLDCKCSWPGAHFDCPCSPHHATNIIVEWESNALLNRTAEFGGECIWQPDGTAKQHKKAVLRDVRDRMELAHGCGFVTFWALSRGWVDPDNATAWNNQLVLCREIGQILLENETFDNGTFA